MIFEDAKKQHSALAEVLRDLHVDVVELPPDENSALSAFVEDVAISCNGTALIARPNETNRLKEVNLINNLQYTILYFKLLKNY